MGVSGLTHGDGLKAQISPGGGAVIAVLHTVALNPITSGSCTRVGFYPEFPIL